MSREGPIRRVIVVGGGLVGWSAAAALKRRIAWLEVVVVPLAPPPDALADRIASTLPSILGFHADLGLSEADAVLRTRSSYRLGALFAGWAGDRPDYVHAYGSHGRPFGATSFHLHWIRLAHEGGATAFDRHSPAAALARADRFVPANDNADTLLGGIAPGLHLDIHRYGGMLRAFALHCGVIERPANMVTPRLNPEDGFIDALTLDDGGELSADLFVDCTGPRALLRGAMDIVRDDWSRWLPCDRVLLAETAPADEASVLDRVTATGAGWQWIASGTTGSSRGIAYASAHSSDAEAADRLVAADAEAITVAAGTRPMPWRGNCVAVGDAATTLEPLEWTGLHLAHSAIDRLIAMLPARDCAPIELAEYNRQAHAEAGRVRDFVALHYAVSARPEPFWREIAGVTPPSSLAHTLALFRERGRLPVYEEETFARDSWLAVLFGQGVLPRRIDPLVDAVPSAQAASAINGFRTALDAAVATAPTHAAYLAAQMRQLAR